MRSDYWATRHPELAHWLHQAEDALVGYAPIDESSRPQRSSLSVSPFFVVIEPFVDRQERPHHRWASMDCLYSQADIETLRTFFAQVHGQSGHLSLPRLMSALRASVSRCGL